MAITTFDFNNPNIAFGGSWLEFINGTTPCNFVYPAATFNFSFTGTNLSLINTLMPPGWTVSVDGGSFGTVPNTSGVFGTCDLTGTLTEGTHTIALTCVSFNPSQSPYIPKLACWQVTGATPALSTTAGFGTSYDLWRIDFLGAIDPDRCIQFASDSGLNFPTAGIFTFSNQYLRPRAKCSSISFWTFQSGQTYIVFIDGVAQPAFTTGSAGPGWVQIISGLDNTTEHEYKIMLVGYPSLTPGDVIHNQIMFVGGTGLNTANQNPLPATLWCAGDSIMCGIQYNDSSTAIGNLLAQARGWAIQNRGWNSATAKDFFTASSVPFNIYSGESPVNGFTPNHGTASGYMARGQQNVGAILLNYGTNDANQLNGTESTSEFQASMTNTILRHAQLFPKAPIYYMGILPRSNLDVTALAPWRAAQTAATAAALAAWPGLRVTLFDMTGVVNTTTDMLGDGLHPNSTGYQKIFTFLNPQITTQSPSGGGGGGSGGFGAGLAAGLAAAKKLKV